MRSSISARSAINNSFAGIFARSASTTLLRPATASLFARVSKRDSGLRFVGLRDGATAASRRFFPGRIYFSILYLVNGPARAGWGVFDGNSKCSK